SRSRHTRPKRDWSADVCSSDLGRLTLTVPSTAPPAVTLTWNVSQVETFQVNVTAGGVVVGTVSVSLPSGASRELSFVWNTSGVELGRASCRERGHGCLGRRTVT